MRKSLKAGPVVTMEIKDLGFSAALASLGHPFDLVDSGNGVILFSFKCKPHEFSRLERAYWSGELSLSARDLLSAHRQLKNRLYALKGPR